MRLELRKWIGNNAGLFVFCVILVAISGFVSWALVGVSTEAPWGLIEYGSFLFLWFIISAILLLQTIIFGGGFI